jgi:hypothetical protein
MEDYDGEDDGEYDQDVQFSDYDEEDDDDYK